MHSPDDVRPPGPDQPPELIRVLGIPIQNEIILPPQRPAFRIDEAAPGLQMPTIQPLSYSGYRCLCSAIIGVAGDPPASRHRLRARQGCCNRIFVMQSAQHRSRMHERTCRQLMPGFRLRAFLRFLRRIRHAGTRHAVRTPPIKNSEATQRTVSDVLTQPGAIPCQPMNSKPAEPALY
jgi:hypothetical protein